MRERMTYRALRRILAKRGDRNSSVAYHIAVRTDSAPRQTNKQTDVALTALTVHPSNVPGTSRD